MYISCMNSRTWVVEEGGCNLVYAHDSSSPRNSTFIFANAKKSIYCFDIGLCVAVGILLRYFYPLIGKEVLKATIRESCFLSLKK